MGLIESPLGWARGKVAWLDTAVIRIESVTPKVIGSADNIIDTTLGAVETNALAVRSGVVSRIQPVHNKLNDVQGFLYMQTLHAVDSSERLIDRLLPAPEVSNRDLVDRKDEQGLVMRLTYLPLRVSVRVTMIVYVSASGAVESVILSGKQVASVARNKQNQFAEQVMLRTKPLTDRLSAVTAPAMSRAQTGTNCALAKINEGREVALSKLHDGRAFVKVNVSNLVIKLHLVEARDWSVDRCDRIRSGTTSVFMLAIQGVHKATSRCVGPQRTEYLFHTLRLPILLDAVNPEEAFDSAKSDTSKPKFTGATAELIAG